MLNPIHRFRCPGWVIAIGSNLYPANHVPRILEELTLEYDRLVCSRIFVTQPIGILSNHLFYNLAVFIPTNQSRHRIKAFTNRLEINMGRNRNDPLRAKRDRPADLDIQFRIMPNRPVYPVWTGNYQKIAILDLLFAMGYIPALKMPPGQEVQIQETSTGQMPTTIHRDHGSGHKIVVKNRFDRPINRLSSAFPSERRLSQYRRLFL